MNINIEFIVNYLLFDFFNLGVNILLIFLEERYFVNVCEDFFVNVVFFIIYVVDCDFFGCNWCLWYSLSGDNVFVIGVISGVVILRN